MWVGCLVDHGLYFCFGCSKYYPSIIAHGTGTKEIVTCHYNKYANIIYITNTHIQETKEERWGPTIRRITSIVSRIVSTMNSPNMQESIHVHKKSRKLKQHSVVCDCGRFQLCIACEGGYSSSHCGFFFIHSSRKWN